MDVTLVQIAGTNFGTNLKEFSDSTTDHETVLMSPVCQFYQSFLFPFSTSPSVSANIILKELTVKLAFLYSTIKSGALEQYVKVSNVTNLLVLAFKQKQYFLN